MKVAQSSILRQIRSAHYAKMYSGDFYTLEYCPAETAECFALLEQVYGLVDNADVVWNYIYQLASGWMPRPSGLGLVYNSSQYNSREFFCCVVLDLARNTLLPGMGG